MSVFENDDTLFAVNLIIPREEDGKIILMRRANCFGEGTWALFGGKIKKGETIKKAAKRELGEECGVEANESDFEIVNIGQTINSRHMLQIGVVVHSYEGQITIAEPQLCDQIAYFDQTDLPGNLFLGTEGNIRKFFAKQRYTLDANITPDAIKSNDNMPILLNLIIVDANNHVLLRRSISGPGFWGLQNGNVKVGETIEQAAVRIVYDNLGIYISESEVIFNNFCMPIINGINTIEIGVVIRHKISEYIFPRLNTEAEYQSERSFPVAMAKKTTPNLRNFFNNTFYSEEDSEEGQRLIYEPKS